MAEPPLLNGAVNVTSADPVPVAFDTLSTAVAVPIFGAPGTVAGVIELLAPDARPVPSILVAVTVNV
jgi:hypothetical protein